MQIGASASAWGADGEYATGALAAEVYLNQQLGLAVRRKYQVEERCRRPASLRFTYMVILDALVRLFCLRKICCIALSVSIPCLNVDKGFGNFRQVHISVLKDKWPRMKSLS